MEALLRWASVTRALTSLLRWARVLYSHDCPSRATCSGWKQSHRLKTHSGELTVLLFCYYSPIQIKPSSVCLEQRNTRLIGYGENEVKGTDDSFVKGRGRMACRLTTIASLSGQGLNRFREVHGWPQSEGIPTIWCRKVMKRLLCSSQTSDDNVTQKLNEDLVYMCKYINFVLVFQKNVITICEKPEHSGSKCWLGWPFFN